MKRKILKIFTVILSIIFIPVVVFYVAIYSWVGFIKLSIIVTGDRIYANKYDKKLAQSVEFALTPDLSAFFHDVEPDLNKLESLEFDYKFKNTKYFCSELGQYSLDTVEVFDKLGLDKKFARIIKYRKRLYGGSLFLIVKDNNEFIPIFAEIIDFNLNTKLHFNEDYNEPHCAKASNLHLKIVNKSGEMPEITIE